MQLPYSAQPTSKKSSNRDGKSVSYILPYYILTHALSTQWNCSFWCHQFNLSESILDSRSVEDLLFLFVCCGFVSIQNKEHNAVSGYKGGLEKSAAMQSGGGVLCVDMEY